MWVVGGIQNNIPYSANVFSSATQGNVSFSIVILIIFVLWKFNTVFTTVTQCINLIKL